MFKFKNNLISFLFLAILLAVIPQGAMATTTNFTVHAGEEITKKIILAVEDHVLIQFTVVGPPENALNFSMVYPDGTLKDFGVVGDFSYRFVCDAEGEYVLRFSNLHSSIEKLVTLDYEVEHYILGIPQMFLLTIIIASLCVAAVAVFVLMGKPR